MSQLGTFNGGGVFPPGSVVQTLEGNSGGVVGPNASNNIFVVGDGTTIDVVGSPGSNTLTISALGSIATEFDADVGTAIPALGVIVMAGGTNMNTSAAGHTVTYNLNSAITLATSVTSPVYLGNAGDVVLKLGDSSGINFVNIKNSGGSNVASVDSLGRAIFDSVEASNIAIGNTNNTISSYNTNGNIILNPNGTGTVNINYASNNGIPVYGAGGSLQSLGPMTNGQILIGSTAAQPVVNTITAGTGIAISNGAGTITVSATGTTTLIYTAIAHSDSPYTVLSTDEFIGCDPTAGVISVLLPNAPATGRVYTIKDVTGQATAHNITVTTVGGAVNIDGATSFVMNTPYESVDVLFNGVSYCLF